MKSLILLLTIVVSVSLSAQETVEQPDNYIALENTLNNLEQVDKFVSINCKMLESEALSKITAYLEQDEIVADAEMILESYFMTCSKKERCGKVAWSLFDRHVTSIEHPQFQYVIKHKKRFQKLVGEVAVNRKLINGFVEHLYKNKGNGYAVNYLRKADIEIYEKARMHQEAYATFNAFFLESDSPEKWERFVETNLKLQNSPEALPESMSYFSEVVYENYAKFNDKTALDNARLVAAEAVLQMPNCDVARNTYAHILFDLGHSEDALTQEEDALRLATAKSNEHVRFYEKEVQRFKKELYLAFFHR